MTFFPTSNTKINPVDSINDSLIILALVGLLFLCGQIIGVIFFEKNLLIVESYLEAKNVYQDFTYKFIIFFCESLFTTILPFLLIYVTSKSKESSLTFLFFFIILFTSISAYQILEIQNINTGFPYEFYSKFNNR